MQIIIMRKDDKGKGVPKKTVEMMGVASLNDPAGIRYTIIFLRFSVDYYKLCIQKVR